jgi:hypothetical protein
MCFVHCLLIIWPAIFDYNKQLILLTVIPLSGGNCVSIFTSVAIVKKLDPNSVSFLSTQVDDFNFNPNSSIENRDLVELNLGEKFDRTLEAYLNYDIEI